MLSRSMPTILYKKRNATNTLGLSCLQKVVATFRMISYGVAADATDDYVRIGESTALESLRRFVRAIVQIFGHEYMRMPNEHDTARLLEIGERRGFPGMLGSIDCMHWTWKDLLFLQGLLKVRVHRLTIASMETIIQWVIISQMAFIHHGPHL